jgi:hypothetical protein
MNCGTQPTTGIIMRHQYCGGVRGSSQFCDVLLEQSHGVH